LNPTGRATGLTGEGGASPKWAIYAVKYRRIDMSTSAATPLNKGNDSIAEVLEQLYQVISFEEGGEPSFSGLQHVFSKHARITRVSPEGTDYMDLSGFLEMVRSMFEAGAYTSFHEFELARRVQSFGNMAQVWSLYETRCHRLARDALNRGVNSIQLLRESEGWRVVALLWDEAHAHPHLEVAGLLQREEQHHGQG
jgi:hypothetical protein